MIIFPFKLNCIKVWNFNIKGGPCKPQRVSLLKPDVAFSHLFFFPVSCQIRQKFPFFLLIQREIKKISKMRKQHPDGCFKSIKQFWNNFRIFSVSKKKKRIAKDIFFVLFCLLLLLFFGCCCFLLLLLFFLLLFFYLLLFLGGQRGKN